jgi:hypothetical protein
VLTNEKLEVGGFVSVTNSENAFKGFPKWKAIWSLVVALSLGKQLIAEESAAGIGNRQYLNSAPIFNFGT